MICLSAMTTINHSALTESRDAASKTHAVRMRTRPVASPVRQVRRGGRSTHSVHSPTACAEHPEGHHAHRLSPLIHCDGNDLLSSNHADLHADVRCPSRRLGVA